MQTVSLQLLASLTGRARGTPANPATGRVLNGRTFNASLKATGTSVTTGSTYANNGFDAALTLPATSTTVLDLRSFTNPVNEVTQAISKLRLFYVQHSPTSPADQISVGNSGANAFTIQGCMGTTPVQLPPGGIFLMAIPSLAGQTVGATAKDVKVANTATTVASYTVGWWGET